MGKYNNDELMHYGVPGMKWGVRKNRSSNSSGTSKHNKKPKEVDLDNDKASINYHKQAIGNKKTHYMSNDELRKAIFRLELEQKYTNLSTTKTATGRDKCTKLFKSDLAKTISKESSKAIVSAGRKFFNDIVFDARRIF